MFSPSKVKDFLTIFTLCDTIESYLWSLENLDMWIWIYILPLILLFLALAWGFFRIFHSKLTRLEWKIIDMFRARTDVFPSLYEVTQDKVARHNEIFSEIMQLRKKEFSLSNLSNEIESFLELEWRIHHEINFIFQVCNKNPKLIKDGNFLYIRDVIMDKSSSISKQIKKYRKATGIYNQSVKYKNYTLIWLLLPYSKKTSI